MKVIDDPRHNARVLAIQYIFQSKEKASESMDVLFIQEQDEIGKYDLGLFTSLTKSLSEHEIEIEKMIGQTATERPISEISKTNLIILKIAILEHNILKLTPRKVSIDEAIELAKEFGTDSDAKFVNGVLDKILEK